MTQKDEPLIRSLQLHHPGLQVMNLHLRFFEHIVPVGSRIKVLCSGTIILHSRAFENVVADLLDVVWCGSVTGTTMRTDLGGMKDGEFDDGELDDGEK